MTMNEDSGALFATDLLAKAAGVPRTHTFIGDDGDEINFTFNGGKAVAVPRRIGMRLAGIEGFEVRDKAGRAIKITASTITVASVTLAPDEAIARYEEMTDAALTKRVEHISKMKIDPETTDRDDLILYLIEYGRAGAPSPTVAMPAGAPAAGGEGVSITMDSED